MTEKQATDNGSVSHISTKVGTSLTLVISTRKVVCTRNPEGSVTAINKLCRLVVSKSKAGTANVTCPVFLFKLNNARDVGGVIRFGFVDGRSAFLSELGKQMESKEAVPLFEPTATYLKLGAKSDSVLSLALMMCPGLPYPAKKIINSFPVLHEVASSHSNSTSTGPLLVNVFLLKE